MAKINGTKAADSIFGTTAADSIFGLAGDDTLWGDYGNDTINGGLGNDTMFGMSGNDRLSGGAGNDYLSDDQSTNRMLGGDGDDEIHGNGFLSGGAGRDVLIAWSQVPVPTELNGGAGADEFNHFFSTVYGDQNITIDDFKPAEGDKLAIGSWNHSTGELSGGDLFQAFDSNHDGQINGNDSDLSVGTSHCNLILYFEAGDLTLKGVDHINAADWIA